MVTCIENSGETVKEAIVIKDATDNLDGIAAEYSYLAKKFGRRDIDWEVRKQEFLEDQGRKYDALEVFFPAESSVKNIYFDITDFFGKL